jgi:hypothetical protein
VSTAWAASKASSSKGSLGDCVDRGRQRRVALRPHLSSGLDRDDVSVGRLVGAGTRADVDHRAGVAEGRRELRRDPWIGVPYVRVVDRQGRVIGVVPVRHRRRTEATRRAALLEKIQQREDPRTST